MPPKRMHPTLMQLDVSSERIGVQALDLQITCMLLSSRFWEPSLEPASSFDEQNSVCMCG